MRTNLTAEYVRMRLEYSADTGVFTWKQKPENNMQDRRWNCAFAGKKAGSFMADGYYQIRLDGDSYLAHRVAWLHFFGENPAGVLDHKDRNKANNAISNIRLATYSQNAFNRTTPSNNTSGTKGVVLDKLNNKWVAQIFCHGRHTRIGSFASKDEAISARKLAEVSLHGEFAVGVNL